MFLRIRLIIRVMMLVLLFSASADINAASLYWDGPNTGGTGDGYSDGGSGTWSTSVANWDTGSGLSREVWDNSANANAVLGGPAGTYTVTLGETINLGQLSITNGTYTISGEALNFSEGGSITSEVTVTISSAISNSPAVSSRNITFAPTAGRVTLGSVTLPTAGDKLYLEGSTSGNSLESVSGARPNVYVSGGAWTMTSTTVVYGCNINSGSELKISSGASLAVNGAGAGALNINNGGTLIVNGSVWEPGWNQAINISEGATLKGTGEVLNGNPATGAPSGPVVVPSNAIIAPGDPTGTLTITNATAGCTIAGALAITVDGPACSTLAVEGHLSVTNATLEVITESLPGTPFIIATYTTLDSPFAMEIGTDKLEIDYNYQGGNAIALIPPPLGTVLILR